MHFTFQFMQNEECPELWAILKGNYGRAFLRRKKVLMENKRVIPGIKKALMENKMAILGIKGHF